MRPSFLDNMSWAMAEVYASVVDRILINLAHYFPYIKAEDEIKGSFEYQARMLAQMGQVNRETVDIIMDGLGGADATLRRALEEAILESLKNEEPKLRKAAEQGLLNGPGFVPPAVTPNQMQAFRTYYNQSADKLNLVNTVMLDSTEQAYRSTVADISAKIQRTQTILNTETGEVVTGVTSYNKAVRDGVKRMVSNGLTGFIDHGGHHWSPEAYVAMDIRTTLFNTSREAVWERNAEYGNDLYQVSTKNGARPLCYPWQGKIISHSGMSGALALGPTAVEMPAGNVMTQGLTEPGLAALSPTGVGTTTDLDGNVIVVHSEDEIESFRHGGGLFGVNCGHYAMVFIPGVSTIVGDPQSPEENEKTYEESQQQRALERKLREEKRDLEVLKAQGASDAEIGAQQAKVRKASHELQAFCDDTGRARRKSREYTPVNASFEGAKTPPFGAPMANVTNEYRATAKPGQGNIKPDPGYKLKKQTVEKNIAEEIIKTYGGDITLRKASGLPGDYTSDYIWRGKFWEQKTVETAKAADAAVRHGLEQIEKNPGGLIITKKKGHDIDTGDLLTVIAKRVNQGAVKKLDVIITEEGKPMRVYRMGNHKK